MNNEIYKLRHLDSDDPLATTKAGIPANSIAFWDTDTLNGKDNITISSSGLQVGNSTDSSVLTVTGELDVNGNSILRGDLEVHGDINLAGSAYETHAEQVYSTSDFIVLRDGNSSSLQNGEYSGFYVKNYNGSHGGAIVLDNVGEARVGNYDLVKVYYDTTNPGTYYSEPELTTEVAVPAGKTIYNIGQPDSDNVQEAYYVALDDTEPLLTRDSLANMTDRGILYWDGANSRAVSTIAPIQSNTALTAVRDPDTLEWSYQWKSSGSGAVFVGTQAQFDVAKLIPEGEDGYLPNNCIVIITDKDDEYLKAEEV